LRTCLFQALQESDSGHRTSHRYSSSNAREWQVAQLLFRDDLCRLSGGREPGQWQSGHFAAFHGSVLQVPSGWAEARI